MLQDRWDPVCLDEHCPPSPRERQAKTGCPRSASAEGTGACSALASRPQLEVTKASPCSRARNFSRLRVTASPVLARSAARMAIRVLGHVSAACGGGEEQKSTHRRAASAESGLLFLVHAEGPLPIWRPDTAQCSVPMDTPLRPWSLLVLQAWPGPVGPGLDGKCLDLCFGPETAPPSPALVCGC